MVTVSSTKVRSQPFGKCHHCGMNLTHQIPMFQNHTNYENSNNNKNTSGDNFNLNLNSMYTHTNTKRQQAYLWKYGYQLTHFSIENINEARDKKNIKFMLCSFKCKQRTKTKIVQCSVFICFSVLLRIEEVRLNWHYNFQQ